MRMTLKKPLALVCSILTCSGLLVAQNGPENTQLAKLYQLQAAFHRALTVQDAVNGDSPDVIIQRIRDMLSLWTSDGQLVLAVNGPRDGNYIGTGDPANDLTCPAPSSSPQNRGTLCTFFKYVNSAMQPSNKFVSLAPSYKTTFDIHGDTATGSFECHYFNVATNPATGQPFWTAVTHLRADVSVRNVGGQWMFSYVTATPAGVPVATSSLLNARLFAFASTIPAC